MTQKRGEPFGPPPVGLPRFGLTAPAGDVPSIFRPTVDAMAALVLRMATTIGLLPAVRAVDWFPRHPSATTLAYVLNMAPSAWHPLRGVLCASDHNIPLGPAW